MVEYLYNAIRATAGDNIELAAIIQTASGESVTEGCHIMLFDTDETTLIATFDGEYIGGSKDYWQFTIPAETTANRLGRYWYRICAENGSLCFKQPIYFHI